MNTAFLTDRTPFFFSKRSRALFSEILKNGRNQSRTGSFTESRIPMIPVGVEKSLSVGHAAGMGRGCSAHHRQLTVWMLEDRWTQVSALLEFAPREEFDRLDYYSLVMARYRLGQPENALALGYEGHERYPWDPGIVDRMMLPYLRYGRNKEALTLWRQTRREIDGGRHTEAMANLVGNAIIPYTKLGLEGRALAELESEFDRWESPLMAGNVACLYARAGRPETALGWMAKALESGKPKNFFETDSDFDSIRDLPRFSELLGRAPEIAPIDLAELRMSALGATTMAGLSWIIYRRNLLRNAEPGVV